GYLFSDFMLIFRNEQVVFSIYESLGLTTSSQAARLSFHSTVSLTVVTVAERSCPVSRPLWPNQAWGPSSETASGLPAPLFTATWTAPDSIKYNASLVSPCENMIAPALKEHSSILSRSLATSSRVRPENVGISPVFSRKLFMSTSPLRAYYGVSCYGATSQTFVSRAT